MVDWKHPAKNDFQLVSQFSITGTGYTYRPRLVTLPNGLPLLVALVMKKKKRGWRKSSSLSCPVPPGSASDEGRRHA